MWKKLGHLVQQPAGYKAYIPLPFPPQEPLELSSALQVKIEQAMRWLGKLDGISLLLPDRDFFLQMFVRKEATASNQIEGTQADIVDAIEAEVAACKILDSDAEDILYYVRALNYGLERAKTLPISNRLIKEIHEKLTKGARTTQNPHPGEFRYTQNWIGGTSPSNAKFVPPPKDDMLQAMSDLERFIHAKNESLSSLVKAALLHAQFETIHPFVDGNGRTGRLLITLFLWQQKLLEIPLLYLSEFFKKHEDIYRERLHAYHENPSGVLSWIDFFVEGVSATSISAISLASEIIEIYKRDTAKILKLGKTAATTATEILRNLYGQPIVDVAKIQEWSKFSTRTGSQKIINRLIDLDILTQRSPEKKYGRMYEYRSYLKLFQREN